MQPNHETAAICGLFCGICACYPRECHGCLSNQLTADCRLCSHGFRACAKAHQVTRCYGCECFPCERLTSFSKLHIKNGIGHHEHILTNLKEMRHIGVDAWVAKQTAMHTCVHCGELILWYERDSHVCGGECNISQEIKLEKN